MGLQRLRAVSQNVKVNNVKNHEKIYIDIMGYPVTDTMTSEAQILVNFVISASKVTYTEAVNSGYSHWALILL